MKRKIKKSLCLLSVFALLMSVPCLSLSSQEEEKTTYRTAVADIENSDYFDSFENSQQGNIYSTVAKKKVSGQALEGYETVSLVDDDYLVTYEVNANTDDSSITLNVYFDNTEERIIENFVGMPMSNYDGEPDVLFDIDGKRMFLSELNELIEQEQCSWFGNIIHHIVNLGLMAVSVVEPAFRIISYVHSLVWNILITAKEVDYVANYYSNSSKTQPTDFVYRQDTYTDWKFGFNSIANAGCATIAGYNLAHALNMNFTLAEVILIYEALGIEVNLAQGFIGSNPYQIGTFLDAASISYKKITNPFSFINYMSDSKDYYIILNEWNGEELSDGYHTFFVDKDTSRVADKFRAYNYWSGTSISSDYSDYFDLFHGSVFETFICAYLVG